jgi:hypothetical protein
VGPAAGDDADVGMMPSVLKMVLLGTERTATPQRASTELLIPHGR